MKSIVVLTAALFAATTAFAQAPAKKEEAKPAAPAASAKDAKAAPVAVPAPAKKEEKKDAAKK